MDFELMIFYNNIKDNLGFEVYEEVYDYIQEIKSRPFSFRKETEQIRVCFTKRFHFAIYFVVVEALFKIWIIGVINQKDNPNKLERRISVLNLN